MFRITAGTPVKGKQVTTDRKSCWEHVFATKKPSDLSWREASSARSRASIRATGVATEAPLIDAGAGLSRLVDILCNCGNSDLKILDMAKTAIERAKERLGAKAASIQWIEEDVKAFGPEGPDQFSGFEVQRYSVQQLMDFLEETFDLQEFHLEDHATPAGTVQQVLYSAWRAKA